jgi:nucleoid-associated protein YgaU
MSKEAKIGLAVILVLLVTLGGVAVWRLKFKSPATPELATADSKEKSPPEADPKAGKAEFGWAESKANIPHNRRETPKILSPSAGQPPKTQGERDLWNIADYRNPRKSAGEATAISPPPSTMPDPPKPDAANPNDRYGLHRHSSSEPESDIAGPPAAGVVAIAESRQHGERHGNSAADDYRFRKNPPAEKTVPPDLVQSASSADYRDPSSGDVPYDRGPSASIVGNEQRRHRGGGYDRWIDSPAGNTSNSGQRGDGTYDVQPNESFSAISKKIYGTESYFKALEELNRGKSPDGQLKVSQNILAPDVAELEKKYPHLCPKADHREVLQSHDATLVSARNLHGTRSYTVVEGDTLFDIARYELGKASRWAEIYELNRNSLGKDFDYLVPGTELALPEDRPERPDPVTRRPVGGFRR